MPYEFKQGDTFSVSGPVSVKDAAGEPIDLSTWSVASSVRFTETGTKVVLTATWLDPGVSLRLFHNATAKWPTGIAEIDVQFTSPTGEKVSTKTEKFKVVEDLTIA